jgi:alpha-D-xyloside xylohydrolase
MNFTKENNVLTGRAGGEILRIEPWGQDSFRVRSTRYAGFTSDAWGLSEHIDDHSAEITVADGTARITNGKLGASVTPSGVISFFKDGKPLLREFHRNYDPSVTKESCALKILPREYTPIIGGDYGLTVRFESRDGEKMFGMGQYQQPYLDLKGCILELAQRNSQVSIPFVLSNLGYGFMWNNPSVGRAVFGRNCTEWQARCTEQMDYWITAGDTPAEIVSRYTAVTGRAPVMPDSLLGLWQCRLRYRTQQEVLDVARRYRDLGIHLDVIVIDFFHWIRQGDWGFDPEYWPDPRAMCDELHAMGTKVMVSVWPSVDRKSVHFADMADKGLLIRTERGTMETYDFNGDCVTFDATNEEARRYIWNVCRENYVKYGIDMFWLDNAEPDLAVYDYDNYRCRLGPMIKAGNVYPYMYAKAFHDGMEEMNKKDIVNLERCAWFGSQKLGVVLWSGDIQSTWESFRDQIAAGLNMGIAGIPWWTTDIGGFMYGNVHDPSFIELLERWFEFAVFCPVLRMHGDRDPHDIPPLCSDKNRDYGGGYLYTGQPNELWSYGPEAQKIFEKNLALRLSLRDYISALMKNAHETGAPVMRTMFFEFPDDEKCWNVSDQYMFGPKYLVAPVLQPGTFSREVYLPEGSWRDMHTGRICRGGTSVSAEAPIDAIPVFERQ